MDNHFNSASSSDFGVGQPSSLQFMMIRTTSDTGQSSSEVATEIRQSSSKVATEIRQSSSEVATEAISRNLPRLLPAGTPRPLLNSATTAIPASSKDKPGFSKFESILGSSPSKMREMQKESAPTFITLMAPNCSNTQPMNNFLVTISNQNQQPKTRRGKPVADEGGKPVADEGPKQRRIGQKQKNPTKRRGRKRKADKANPMLEDYEKEMAEMRKKIQGRFESKKKAVVRKEHVGYTGPYVKAYAVPDYMEGSVPMPNTIVDDLEGHLGESSKSKYHLHKNSGLNLDGPFVCYFCHFDPMAERETAAGDLIGPIALPTDAHGRPRAKATAYFHEKCLQWSANFRMFGFDIVDLPGLLNDAKTICSYCQRKGATIGCSAPLNCPKAFHYPCATLANCRMVPASHQVFCEDHNCNRRTTVYEEEVEEEQVEEEGVEEEQLGEGVEEEQLGEGVEEEQLEHLNNNGEENHVVEVEDASRNQVQDDQSGEF